MQVVAPLAERLRRVRRRGMCAVKRTCGPWLQAFADRRAHTHSATVDGDGDGDVPLWTSLATSACAAPSPARRPLETPA